MFHGQEIRTGINDTRHQNAQCPLPNKRRKQSIKSLTNECYTKIDKFIEFKESIFLKNGNIRTINLNEGRRN